MQRRMSSTQGEPAGSPMLPGESQTSERARHPRPLASDSTRTHHCRIVAASGSAAARARRPTLCRGLFRPYRPRALGTATCASKRSTCRRIAFCVDDPVSLVSRNRGHRQLVTCQLAGELTAAPNSGLHVSSAITASSRSQNGRQAGADQVTVALSSGWTAIAQYRLATCLVPVVAPRCGVASRQVYVVPKRSLRSTSR